MRRTFAIGVVRGTQYSELWVGISGLLVDPGEVLGRSVPAVTAGNLAVEIFSSLAMQHGQITPNDPKRRPHFRLADRLGIGKYKINITAILELDGDCRPGGRIITAPA